MKRPLKEVATGHEQLVGTTLSLPGAAVAELLAEAFDLVWIDLEHAALGPLDAQELIIGAQAAGAYALVRLPAEAHELMAVMLDAGADGVVLANLTDPSTAQRALRRTQHPPAGTRGYGPRRLSQRGRRAGQAPPPPSIWAQIECALDHGQAAEIAALPGIDAVVVGTADLSFAVGTPLDIGSRAVRDAVQSIRDAAVTAGTAFGIAGSLGEATLALADGASILVLGTDARLCSAAVDSAAQQMRDVLNAHPQESEPS